MIETYPGPSGAEPNRRGILRRVAGLGALAAVAPLRSMGAADNVDLNRGEVSRADQRAQLCSAVIAAGVGLQGEYFPKEQCQGQALLKRVDGPLDFDGTLEWPAERNTVRPKSARWSGWVRPPLRGLYQFHLDAPDVRVVVAKQTLVGTDATATGKIELAAGRFYPITVEMGRLSAVAARDRIRLEWTAPYGSRFIVPRVLLYLPTAT